MAPDPSKGIPMSLKKRVMFSLISGGDEDSLGDRGGGMLSSLVRGPGGGVAPVGAGKEPDSECRETLTHAIAEHETNWDHGKALHESHFTDDVILQGVTLRDSDPILASEARVARLKARDTEVLLYAGWYDSGSVVSANRVIKAIGRGRMVIGPWTHGLRMACSPHQSLREPKYDMYGHVAEWLQRVYQGIENQDPDPAIMYFVMGTEAWKGAEAWPPPESKDSQPLFFDNNPKYLKDDPDGLLTSAPTDGGSMLFHIDAEATTPVASRWNLVQHILEEPVEYGNRAFARGTLRMTAEDRRGHPFTIAGSPRVSLDLELFGGDDAAVFVYLEDVSPNGDSTYVTEGCVRAGFAAALRQAGRTQKQCQFTRAELKKFNTREVLPIELQPVAYEFKAGHRVRLSITGADKSNFLPVENAASSWTIHYSASTYLVLPEMPSEKDASTRKGAAMMSSEQAEKQKLLR